MPQLDFEYNELLQDVQVRHQFSIGTLKIIPMMIRDSISLGTINLLGRATNTSLTLSLSIGLYSLTGSTLSLANSVFGSHGININGATWLSFTSTSATQNITPGTWYFGLLGSTSNTNAISLLGNSLASGQNNFPGAFVGGRMTATTGALPASIATSDLDIAGGDAMASFMILLSA